ncbi:MAG: hypothetical protein J7K46_08190, partial [Bacteroidales bacterium]|nr:hypothetical protein [Bacteroidales bacterium]
LAGPAIGPLPENDPPDHFLTGRSCHLGVALIMQIYQRSKLYNPKHYLPFYRWRNWPALQSGPSLKMIHRIIF